MAVSKRVRYEVLRRDNHACRYCGATAPDVKLTIDHVVPQVLGGADTPDNLVAACRDCNAGKTSSNPDSPLVDDVASDALRWARAMRQAADHFAIHDDQIAFLCEEVYAVWDAYDLDEDHAYLPANWQTSIEQFARAGLTQAPVLCRLLAKTMTDPRLNPSGWWRYFCGCCWGRIRDMQDAAYVIVSEGDI